MRRIIPSFKAKNIPLLGHTDKKMVDKKNIYHQNKKITHNPGKSRIEKTEETPQHQQIKVIHHKYSSRSRK